MRVAKIIKEYVEETVNGIYDPIIGNCSKDYSIKKNEVEDILVNLELGGTKAELDEMLKNIREEVAG